MTEKRLLFELRAEIRHEDYTQALRLDELGMVFLRVDKVIQNAVKRLPTFEVSSPDFLFPKIYTKRKPLARCINDCWPCFDKSG
jgi:hypothetical protein